MRAKPILRAAVVLAVAAVAFGVTPQKRMDGRGWTLRTIPQAHAVSVAGCTIYVFKPGKTAKCIARKIKEAAKVVWRTVTKTVTKWVQPGLKWFKKNISKAWDWVKKTIPGLPGFGAIKQMADLIKHFFKVMKKGPSYLAKLLTDKWEKIKSFMGKVKKTLEAVSLKRLAQQPVKAVKEFLNKAFKLMDDTIFRHVGKAFKFMWKTLKTAGRFITDKLVIPVVKRFQKIGKGIKEKVFDKVLGLITNTSGKVFKALKKAFPTAKQLGDMIVKAIHNAAFRPGELKSLFWAFASKDKTEFYKIFRRLKNRSIAENLIRVALSLIQPPLIRLINNALGKVIEWALGIAANAVLEVLDWTAVMLIRKVVNIVVGLIPAVGSVIGAVIDVVLGRLWQAIKFVARIIVVPVAKALVGFIAKAIARHLVKFVVKKIPNMVLDAASKASWFQKATHWVSNKIILPALRGALSVVTPFRKGFTGMLDGIKAVGQATGLVASAPKAPSKAELKLPRDDFKRAARKGPSPIPDTTSLAVLESHSRKEPGSGADETSILEDLKNFPDSEGYRRLKGAMRLSSSHPLYPASKAMDGNRQTFAHSGMKHRPWWEVKFARAYQIKRIVIWNRHNCCQHRLNNSDLSVFDSAGRKKFSKHIGRAGMKLEISLPNVSGRRVRLQLRGREYLNFGEIEIYGRPAIPRPPLVGPGGVRRPGLRPAIPRPPLFGPGGVRRPVLRPPVRRLPAPKPATKSVIKKVPNLYQLMKNIQGLPEHF